MYIEHKLRPQLYSKLFGPARGQVIPEPAFGPDRLAQLERGIIEQYPRLAEAPAATRQAQRFRCMLEEQLSADLLLCVWELERETRAAGWTYSAAAYHTDALEIELAHIKAHLSETLRRHLPAPPIHVRGGKRLTVVQ